ncbi:hypothetical protein [Streptomyces sp. NPDC058954]|uniref:hypothetical protein n=1 Tax=Streptomyces sp. NPDC058954 TaxID=3346677 RepID=UPI0036BC475B
MVVTLVVQGFSLSPVVRRSGIALEPAHIEGEEAEARSRLARAGMARLKQLAELEAVPDIVLGRIRRGLTPVSTTPASVSPSVTTMSWQALVRGRMYGH